MDLFPYGNYIIEMLPIEITQVSLTYFLQLDNTFYLLVFIIIATILNLMNFIFLIILLIFINKYKLIISLMLPLYKLKNLINGCKFIFLILYYIFNLFNIGGDDILLIFNNPKINNILETKLSNKIRLLIMGEEEEDNILTNYNKSQLSISSQPQERTNYLFNSGSNSKVDIITELNTQNIDISDKDIIEDDYDIDESFKTNVNLDLIKDFTVPGFNFNSDLNLEEKHLYIKNKMCLKGMEPHFSILVWFTSKLDETDGSKSNIDKLIESNLNSLLKIERDAKLNNLAFFRNKPFLMNKIYNSPLTYPNVIPVFKN